VVVVSSVDGVVFVGEVDLPDEVDLLTEEDLLDGEGLLDEVVSQVGEAFQARIAHPRQTVHLREVEVVGDSATEAAVVVGVEDVVAEVEKPNDEEMTTTRTGRITRTSSTIWIPMSNHSKTAFDSA
jgi:hypothetical protein